MSIATTVNLQALATIVSLHRTVYAVCGFFLIFKYKHHHNAIMSNAVLIILAIVFSLILIAVNIYLLALYVHTDDKGFGTALYCKILVVAGLTLCQAQALCVPLDVAN